MLKNKKQFPFYISHCLKKFLNLALKFEINLSDPQFV
jgi:hypothetical protein